MASGKSTIDANLIGSPEHGLRPSLSQPRRWMLTLFVVAHMAATIAFMLLLKRLIETAELSGFASYWLVFLPSFVFGVGGIFLVLNYVDRKQEEAWRALLRRTEESRADLLARIDSDVTRIVRRGGSS